MISYHISTFPTSQGADFQEFCKHGRHYLQENTITVRLFVCVKRLHLYIYMYRNGHLNLSLIGNSH